ncbi:hypothetical protein AVEN_126013-1 [Araneus ventricosus]|uniref:Uncharacterized protein n=1 Tax=Araneus ventricosus TaxID=182803 RepID=A0A4Y2RM01_ARAVE|nr:hypothetical protein AVEN_190370-1 [Araneus ventricosus]GBN76493.1 hypothetical protein AVEN_126013-1 [Araneus ventricosus]
MICSTTCPKHIINGKSVHQSHAHTTGSATVVVEGTGVWGGVLSVHVMLNTITEKRNKLGGKILSMVFITRFVDLYQILDQTHQQSKGAREYLKNTLLHHRLRSTSCK